MVRRQGCGSSGGGASPSQLTQGEVKTQVEVRPWLLVPLNREGYSALTHLEHFTSSLLYGCLALQVKGQLHPLAAAALVQDGSLDLHV